MNQGERIKKILRQNNVSQKEVAEKLGVHGAAVTRHLAKAVVPDEYLKAISELLEVDLQSFKKMIADMPDVESNQYAILNERLELQEKLLEEKDETIRYMAKLIKTLEQHSKP